MKSLKKGFTLVEMIMTIMLMSMIGIIIGIIFNTMFAGRELVEREASIQSEMRTSMQTVDRTIGKATSIFILDSNKYDGSKSKLTKNWSYVGLSEDGKKVLNYVWNKNKKDWDISELGVKSLYNMKLDLVFKTDSNYKDNRLVTYNLTGKYPDTNSKLSLKTAIAALNSKQVFSKVAKGKKGIAIAYRNDPIEGQMNTSISFVFDTSGSMKATLNGHGTKDVNQTRMAILKKNAKKLVTDLSSIGNVSVNLVRFSTLGSYVQESFLDVASKKDEIFNKIDSLPTTSATNPGDGLRYGLVSLQKNPAQLKYAVLLTDGVPNVRTIAAGHGKRIKIPHGVMYSPQEEDLSDNVGSKASKSTHHIIQGNKPLKEAIYYPGHVAEKFGHGIKRINVIGFSGIKAEKQYGQEMTDAIGKSGVEAVYTDVADEAGLEKTFADIKKQIEQDLWFVSGP